MDRGSSVIKPNREMKPQVKSQKLGALFEKAISEALTNYSIRNWMVAEKVSPPARVFGKRVIFLSNPFLDFVGVHVRTQRAVFIEAKYTENPRLTMNAQLSKSQIISLERWSSAGAIAFVLWCVAGRNVYLIPARKVIDVYPTRKHLTPDDCYDTQTPTGTIVDSKVRFFHAMEVAFGISQSKSA